MATQYTFPMSAWIGFGNLLAETSLERMQEMTEKLQRRQYSPSDLLTDALGFWVDGVNSWWSVIQQAAAGPVPFAFIKMRTDEEAANCEVPVRKVGSEDLRWTDLVRLGDGGSGAAPKLSIHWANDKPNCAVVEVHGLEVGHTKTDKLHPGLYQSSVHMDEQLVAIVQILVQD